VSGTPSHHQFFGDQERAFALRPELIAELERKTGSGIGGLTRRLCAGDFRHAELLETIRLGLIGGGADPEEAAALVRAYAEQKPVMDLYALALPIIEITMFGASPTPDDGRGPEESWASSAPGHHNNEAGREHG
jgi:hypothetical protein